MRILAEAAFGVVKGQVEDIAAGKKDARYVYAHKTADLFVAAAKMGAVAAGGTRESVDALGRFALNLGLAFQYEDDLLDGDGLYAPDETARLAAKATADAIASLEGLPGDVSALKSLASRLLGRKT